MELIIGAIVSLLVQVIKQWTGTKGNLALALVILVSISASFIYISLVRAELWETVVQVLTTAGAFYAFILSRFEKEGK